MPDLAPPRVCIVHAKPSGEIAAFTIPKMPRREQLSEADYVRFVGQHALACGMLSCDPWASADLIHVATVDPATIEAKRKRWGGYTRIEKTTEGGMAVIDSVPMPLRWNGSEVVVDPDGARKQIVAELRHKRDLELTESDKDKARFDEIGTKEQQKQIKEYRQKLRDLPVVVLAEIASMTVDQLENYKPQFPTIGE